MTRDAEHTPSPQSVVVPVGRLKLTDRVVLGDVLRARKSFTNPDILTKGDVVIVQAVTDDGCVYFQNLFRCSPQAGLRLDWFDFVHRPPTRLKADYSHMSAAPAPSSLAGGISREQVLAIVRQFASPSWCSVDRLVDTLLAALSPEAPAREVTDAMVEAACYRFVSESDDIWSASVWPEGLDDDGDRGDGGRVRLISEDDQHKIRAAMRFALQDALTSRHEAPAREGVDIEDMRTRARYLRGYAPKVSAAMYGGEKPSGIWNLNRAADLLDQAADALTPRHEAPASEGYAK